MLKRNPNCWHYDNTSEPKFWLGYVTDFLKDSKLKYKWRQNFVLTLSFQILEAKEHPGINPALIRIEDFLVEVVMTFWISQISVLIGFYTCQESSQAKLTFMWNPAWCINPR